MTSYRFDHDGWTAGDSTEDTLQAVSFVRGVSLSGVLQMLHLERKTCVLEVISGRHFGALTLVNGELVDAGVGDLDGEEAVYQILTWPQPRTTILDGVNLFRNSVSLPLSRILVELVRRQDEGESRESPQRTADGAESFHAAFSSSSSVDWNHLVESMIIAGALAAAIFDSTSDSILAIADEFGGSLSGLSAAALTDLIPSTSGLRAWLLNGDGDDLVARRNGLYVFISPLERNSTRFAYALHESTESVERIRSACRLNAAI